MSDCLLDEQLQPTTDGLAEGRRLADHGMAIVEAASTEQQRIHVDQVISDWARSGREWSLNDLRPQLPDVRPALVGARVMHASKTGLIRHTGEYVPSTLRSTRGHRIAVWVGADG